MKWALPIAMQLAGFLVLLAEILIPSFGILTLISLSLLAYSWYHIVTSLPQSVPWFLAADILLVPFFLYLGFKVFKASPLTLKGVVKGTGMEEKYALQQSLIGKRGTAETGLRPTGKVMVEGQLIDAVSDGDFIEPERPVEITEISGLKVVVRSLEEPA